MLRILSNQCISETNTQNLKYFTFFWGIVLFSSNMETLCQSYVPFAMFLHCHLKLYLTLYDALVLPGIFCTVRSHSLFHSLFPCLLLTAIWPRHYRPWNPIYFSPFLLFFFLCILLQLLPQVSHSVNPSFSLLEKNSSLPLFFQYYQTLHLSSPCPVYHDTNSFSVPLTAPSKQDLCFHSILFSCLPCSSICHLISCLF